MPSTRLCALALATAATFASGCGGSSKSSNQTQAAASGQPAGKTEPASSTEPVTNGPLTKAQLIAKADAICERVNDNLAGRALLSREAYIRILPEAAAQERYAYEEFSKLVPPSSMAHDWKLIITGTKQFSEYSEAFGQYLKNHKLDVHHRFFIAARDGRQQVITIAKKDGFDDCSRLA